MYLVKYHGLVLCLLFFHTEALKCRSEGGPKDAELKSIYKKCLKMQDGKNSTNNRDNGDQDWKDQGRNSQNDWDRDQMSSNSRGRSREERSGSRNDRRGGTDGRMGSYDDNDGNMGSNNGDSSGSYGDRMGGSDRAGSYDDRMGSISSRMGRYGNDRDDSTSNRDSGYGRDHGHNGRNEFQHDDYGSDTSSQYGQSSTQSSRRYKRERHTENSGQRSQFNPNSSKRSSNYDDSYQSDDKNSKEKNSSKDDDRKACALHCFLENLKMTAEDGMPDRYLVTHSLTKDVTNEDLKDFLQESIEECFQILDNENTEEDKCEFSKTLLMCLSEKGRANCDDWKDDLRF